MLGGEATVTVGLLGDDCHACVKTAFRRRAAATCSALEATEAQQGEAGLDPWRDPSSDASDRLICLYRDPTNVHMQAERFDVSLLLPPLWVVLLSQAARPKKSSGSGCGLGSLAGIRKQGRRLFVGTW